MGTKDNTYANTGKRLYFLSDDVDNESIGQLTWNILHQLAEDDEKDKKEKDYKRSVGKLIDIKLYKPVDKCKEFTGVLDSYDKDTVTIKMDDDTQKTFDRSNLAMIRLAFCE